MEGEVSPGVENIIEESSDRFANIASKLIAEQTNQILIWGKKEQEESDGTWMIVLMEEVGEAARSILEGSPHHLRQELIQVAAVAMSWIDNIDRRASGEIDKIDGDGDEDS